MNGGAGPGADPISGSAVGARSRARRSPAGEPVLGADAARTWQSHLWAAGGEVQTQVELRRPQASVVEGRKHPPLGRDPQRYSRAARSGARRPACRTRVVVGAGPNGLAAAIVLARAGRSVLVLEAADTVGGGTRTAELTLPGFRHDVCSAIHPLVPGSPFLRSLPLEEHGLEWIESPAALAHPFDDGTAAMLERSIPGSAGATLGADAPAHTRRLMGPLARNADTILAEILGPFRLPRHPLVLARFGLNAILPAATLARRAFRRARTPAGCSAGLAAHSMLPLTRSPSAAVGARARAPRPSCRLAVRARGLAGDRGRPRLVPPLARRRDTDGPPRRIARRAAAERAPCFADVTPRQLPATGRATVSRTAIAAGSRATATGPGSSSSTSPSTGRSPGAHAACARAATVHLGGTLDEIVLSEAAVSRGLTPEQPYVLVAQQSLFDPTRAPAGKHTAWAYCHVPNGSERRHDRSGSRRSSNGSLRDSASSCSPVTRMEPADDGGLQPELRRR